MCPILPVTNFHLWSKPVRTILYSCLALLICLVAQPASAKIVHRWSFDKDESDSVGGAKANLQGGAAVKEGKLVLDGQNNYAELPIGKTIEKLKSASFEAW